MRRTGSGVLPGGGAPDSRHILSPELDGAEGVCPETSIPDAGVSAAVASSR